MPVRSTRAIHMIVARKVPVKVGILLGGRIIGPVVLVQKLVSSPCSGGLWIMQWPHTTYTCGVYVFTWLFLPFGPVLAFYSCFDLGSPLCSVYAPEPPKMDGRRRRLGGRAALSPRVDILVPAPVKGNEGDRSHLDSGSGSGLKDDRSIGFGQSARDDEDAETRAVSADSSHAIRGERDYHSC